jgi:DNA helicase IV
MKALEDDPSVPAFFGRLDYEVDHVERGASFRIGRRQVTDEHGEPMVVDWRAPISLPFYRAAPRAPMGVRMRRRFGFQRGQITAFEDERLGEGTGQEYSRFLEEEVERPRVGPMRDIVATIQPRAGPHRPGRPGHLGVRAGRARDRQDRRGAAPCGVSALRPPRLSRLAP